LIPADPALFCDQAGTLIGIGDFEAALKDLDYCMKLDSTYSGVRANRAVAYNE
jgi:hypothetical protein